MADICSNPTKDGLYQAYFIDFLGRHQYLTKGTSKEALKAVRSLEKEHNEIRRLIKLIGARAPRDERLLRMNDAKRESI